MNSPIFLPKILLQLYEAFVSQDSELFDVVFEIDGKKLHANKFWLSLASSTFKSMLSKRWNKQNDEPIKIETYKYEDFKEFLTFIYSGKCNVTDDNIWNIVDMAEFYQVDDLKILCDQYLLKTNIDFNNVFQLMELSTRYSVTATKQRILAFITQNFEKFCQSTAFLKADNSVIEEIISFKSHQNEPEKLFQAIYKWAEHQATKPQKESTRENPNKENAIKTEIAPFLPHIQFKKMNLEFLKSYVVKKSFLFSDDELKDILKNAVPEIKVKVTNLYGQSISGILKRDSVTVEFIKTLKNQLSDNTCATVIWWKAPRENPLISCPTRDLPSTPCQLKKRNGVDFYLVYFPDGDVGVRNSKFVSDNCYLLAEMYAETGEFKMSPECKIEIE